LTLPHFKLLVRYDSCFSQNRFPFRTPYIFGSRYLRFLSILTFRTTASLFTFSRCRACFLPSLISSVLHVPFITHSLNHPKSALCPLCKCRLAAPRWRFFSGGLSFSRGGLVFFSLHFSPRTSSAILPSLLKISFFLPSKPPLNSPFLLPTGSPPFSFQLVASLTVHKQFWFVPAHFLPPPQHLPAPFQIMLFLSILYTYGIANPYVRLTCLTMGGFLVHDFRPPSRLPPTLPSRNPATFAPSSLLPSESELPPLRMAPLFVIASLLRDASAFLRYRLPTPNFLRNPPSSLFQPPPPSQACHKPHPAS